VDEGDASKSVSSGEAMTDPTLKKLKELAHVASLERKRRGTSLYCCIICAQPEHDERCPIWVAMEAAYTLGLSQGQMTNVEQILSDCSRVIVGLIDKTAMREVVIAEGQRLLIRIEACKAVKNGD
jgi:hypothetical protein